MTKNIAMSQGPVEGQVWEDGIDPVFWLVESAPEGVDTVTVRMLLANETPTATTLTVARNRWRTFVDRQQATLRAD